MAIAMEMAGMTEMPPDCAIYVPGEGISRIICGIDMGVAELEVATRLGFDCVLAHHPQPAVLTFPAILERHIPLMVAAGVPADEAARAVAAIREPIALRHHSGNYDHAPSFARLLGMPYLNIHGPLDEIGRRRMQAAIDCHVRPDDPVSAVVDALMTIPEVRQAPTRPLIAVGDAGGRAGKVVVAHGAGTNGGYPVARAYFAHGVGTVIYLHCEQAGLQRLRAEGAGNLVLAGHIAADAAGIQPYLAELERRGLEITRVSGL
jgi:putative NIF3 family GTP cyclohydrolase 1 type 2